MRLSIVLLLTVLTAGARSFARWVNWPCAIELYVRIFTQVNAMLMAGYHDLYDVCPIGLYKQWALSTS